MRQSNNILTQDISLLVAEAYKLKYMFADAPSHLTECRINKPFLS